jgi:imidazole glycerol-phosphate synthase subunit HisF
MLRKRLIFTLIYSDGFFMQSRNFRLQKVGNIDWLEKNYQFRDISFSLDELIVLDASRGDRNITRFSEVLSRLTEDVFIPISAGGGVRSINDAESLFNNGADKIILNSMLFENKKIVLDIIKKYGSQSVVGSVDYISDNVFINNGEKKIEIPLEDYINVISNYGVGEIYLNSIENDGTGFGYDIKVIHKISRLTQIPLIVAGGAGNEKHLLEVLLIDNVDAAATANLFNFIGDGLPNARKIILDLNGNLAHWG